MHGVSRNKSAAGAEDRADYAAERRPHMLIHIDMAGSHRAAAASNAPVGRNSAFDQNRRKLTRVFDAALWVELATSSLQNSPNARPVENVRKAASPDIQVS